MIALWNDPSIVKHICTKITLPFPAKGKRDNYLLAVCATSMHSVLGLDLSSVFQIPVSDGMDLLWYVFTECLLHTDC